MKMRIPVSAEKPLQQILRYLLYYGIFIALTTLSHELWLTLTCGFLSFIVAIRAFVFIAETLFDPEASSPAREFDPPRATHQDMNFVNETSHV